MFEKAKLANSLPFARNGRLFMWGAYFCMGAYKRDVVVVIKMGAYIHGVLILCGCLLYGITCYLGTTTIEEIWETSLYVAYSR